MLCVEYVNVINNGQNLTATELLPKYKTCEKIV